MAFKKLATSAKIKSFCYISKALAATANYIFSCDSSWIMVST